MHTSIGTTPALHAVLDAIPDGNAADWQATSTKHTDFTCWEAWEHLVDCYQHYTANLADTGSQGPWLQFAAHIDETATVPDLKRLATTHAHILDTIIAATPGSARGWHPCGISDAEGFAAMAVVETLVHGWDVVTALEPESTWLPPNDHAALAINRLFPEASKICFESGIKTPHHGELLLHLCGRTPFGTHPKREEWQWDGHVRHTDLHVMA